MPARSREPRHGLRGVRVGEASHPGLTRRRLRSSSVEVPESGPDTVVDDLSGPRDLTSPRIMRTQVDVSSDDEPLMRPVSGRHVVPRVTQTTRDRDGVVDGQEPTNTDCGATVPASPGALIAANRFFQLAPTQNENL